jgi:hypothetical protein
VIFLYFVAPPKKSSITKFPVSVSGTQKKEEKTPPKNDK